MTTRTWTLGIFLLTCLAQLAFASSALWRGEATLSGGSLYRFVTDPVDPVDPFRGRYVALAFRPVHVPTVGGTKIDEGGTAYVELGVDAEGFGKLVQAHSAPPAADHLALPVLDATGSGVKVQLPFQRYYAEEERVLEIDRERWVAGGRFVVAVRVLDGRGVIEALELGEVPAPLSAADIQLPDPRLPPPDGLLEALRATMGPNGLRRCRAASTCVLFEVDLDRSVEREFAFQHANGGLVYWVEHEGGWRRAGTFHLRGRRSLPAHQLLPELRSSGAHPADPPLRDLRIGERTWMVR